MFCEFINKTGLKTDYLGAVISLLFEKDNKTESEPFFKLIRFGNESEYRYPLNFANTLR